MTTTLRTHTRRAALAGAALVLLVAVAVVLQLAAATAAEASVWVIPGTGRALPSTPAGSRQRIDLQAAGNEYEAAQVVTRGAAGRSVRLTWSADSDPLIVRASSVSEVGFVTVTHPTTDLHAKAGPYPDPLLPRAFGAAIKAYWATTTFYVQVHVPYGTPAGDHTGTLHIVNGAETLDLPVTLHVYGFGWPRLSTHTAFAFNVGLVGRSIQGSGVSFSGANKRRIMDSYDRFLAAHGITTTPNQVWPKVTAAGHIDASSFAASLAARLDENGLGEPDARLPWVNYFPWSQSTYSPSSSRLLTYLTELCKVYADHRWQNKAYAYILDETTSISAERKAEAYARTLHKASAKAGFRCRFLLTDDPRPRSLGGIHTANSFLFDDVDVWVPRFYYFFGRVPALRQLQAKGKQVWWYFYSNHFVYETPSFVIEKSHADQRVIPWLMQAWNVEGLLNWGTNRWGDPLTGNGWRDPYRNTMSYRKRDGRVSNGETSLIYPGYYPRYGLTDPYAGPVSSLRLEALRDGFEDLEYLKLASATGADGPGFVKKVVGKITWFPYTIRQANVYNFPKYTTSAGAFASARAQLAARIEAYGAQ